jgi:hypothetical protein
MLWHRISALGSYLVPCLSACLAALLIVSCGDDTTSAPEGDNVLPTISIASPVGGTLDTRDVWTFTGTSSDNIEVTAITWETPDGSSGSVPGDPSNWSVDIALGHGDQIVTFTAQDAGGNEASASVTVIHSHFLLLTSAPQLFPNATVTDIPVMLRAYATLDPSSVGSDEERTLSAVELVLTDDGGDVVAVIGPLTDDGNLGNGDEIEGDNLYSLLSGHTFAAAHDHPFRIRATYDTPAKETVEDFTGMLVIEVVQAAEQTQLQEAADAGSDAYDFADDLLEGGEELSSVVTQTATYLSGNAAIATVGISEDDYVVWYRSTAGVRGNIVFNPEGTRGGGTSLGDRGGPALDGPYVWAPDPQCLTDVGSNSVIIYDAYNSQFAPFDEAPFLHTLFDDSECPVFTVEYYVDAQCTVNLVDSFSDHGTIILVTHGGRDNGEVFFMTREQVTTQSLQDHNANLVLGNLTISTVDGVQYFSILPGYIDGLPNVFPESVVYNGSCESQANNTMADAFLDSGAMVYLGFTRVVNSDFAQSVSQTFFQNMVTDHEDSDEAFTAGQVDPTAPNATFTMSSDDEAEYTTELTNASFEEGDLRGWTAAGDGRVITALGAAAPTDGAFMGIISTGLGYTVSSGSVTASLCNLSDGESLTLHFDWNFFSEEFMEWCGSDYQDFFYVVAIVDGAETTLMHYTLDDLCGSVSAVGVSFDQGDVYSTGWRSTSLPLPTVPEGSSLVISFRAGDVGDSVYDTAILIDDVRIE